MCFEARGNNRIFLTLAWEGKEPEVRVEVTESVRARTATVQVGRCRKHANLGCECVGCSILAVNFSLPDILGVKNSYVLPGLRAFLGANGKCGA